jgi:Uma2 family endonuclease
VTNTVESSPKTYDDYLNSPDDGQRYEVIDGEFVINPSCSIIHQRALMVLLCELYDFCERPGVGEALLGPVEIRLETDLVLQPDFAFVRSGAVSCVLTERGTFGPPTIIFEVVAP